MNRFFSRAILSFFGAMLVASCNASDSADKIAGGAAPVTIQAPTQTQSGLTLNIVGGNNQTDAPGATYHDALRVQLLDGGVPVSGRLVNFTVVSGTLTFGASSSLTDSSGMVQTYVTAGSTPGAVLVRASYNSSTVDFNLAIADQTNATLVRISGDAQTGGVGTTLAQAFIVETRDGSGHPLPNILVRFSVVTGNGHINTSNNTLTLSSDGTGRASVNFDLGTLAGANSVAAAIVSVPAQNTSFSATGSVPAASTVSLSQSSISTAVSSLVADGSQTTTATLTTRDVFGNVIPVGGKTVAFTLNVGTVVGATVDNGDGTYSALIRVPANNATATMTLGGTVNTQALTSTAAHITLTSGSLSLTQSTVTTSSSSVTADGSTLILCTATLKDSIGNQQTTGGQSVSFASSLGTLIGSVTDNGNGTYTQSLKAGTLAGNAVVSAAVYGSGALAQTKSVAFLAGAPDDTQSTIVATPSTLLPNGAASSVVTVQLRDSYGNIATTATSRTVSLSKTGGTWMGSASSTVTATSNNDGTYFAILTAGTNYGTSVITASDNTTVLTKSATIYFSNGNYGPSASNSLVQLSTASPVPADGASTVAVTVTLKDSYFNQLTTGGSSVVISATAGTLVGSVVDHGDGTYTQVLRAPSASAVSNVSVTVDGNSLTRSATASFYGAISLAQSTISASPNSVVANGIATTVIYLSAKDASGISIPVGGATSIVFASTYGTFTGSVTDNANGVYSQVLTSPSSAHNGVVTATLAGTAFSGTTTVSFYTSNNLAGLTIDCGNIATYQNTTIVVSNGTLTMNTRSAAGYCPASFTFAGIVLQNNAVLTHSVATNTQEFGLEFTANYVSIDATSAIDVTGKGYSEANAGYLRNQGNVDFGNGNAGYRLGGSYGGQGASNNGIASIPTNSTYGSIYQPIDLGSSGSNNYGVNAGGGGRIKMTVTGQAGISNLGAIRAQGGVPVNNDGSGSGGSIWINTTALTGTGIVSADGGRYTLQSGSFAPSSGGGGRVAIYYSADSLAGNFNYPSGALNNITAKGGISYGGCAAGAGTVYLKSTAQTYGDLIIDNKGAALCTGYTYGTIINSPGTFTSESLGANSLTKTNFFRDTYNAAVSPFVGFYVDPNIAQNATPKKSDNQLFPITAATVSALTTSGASMASVATVSNTAELVLVLDNFELGDNTPIVPGNLKIISYGGDLRSNDATTVTMTANYPPAGMEYPGLQNLNINLSSLVMPAMINEDFGSTNVSLSNGTFSYTALKTGNFSATTMNLTGGTIASTGSVTLTSATAVMGAPVGNNTIQAAGVISIAGTSTITQVQTTANTEYSLEFLGAGITVGANATVTSNSKGFAQVTGNNYRVFGNQNTSVGWNGSTNNNGGGSHAGRGGTANTGHFSADVYGSFYNPYTSGGCALGSGNGGGIIRLITTNNGAVTLDGVVDARGSPVTQWGGAGGSIYVNGGVVSGNGSIDASGATNTGYVGGGGGRVAVFYTSLGGNFTYPANAVANIRAYGGSGNNNVNGPNGAAAGTVFLKSSAELYGKLIINNNNIVGLNDTNGRRTVVNLPVPTNNASISYNSTTGLSTITANASFGEAYGSSNAFVGMYLNPNTAQNGTVKVSDDTLFKIVAQTANTLTVQGNITTVASNGSRFQLVMRFDAMKIINNAILEIDNGVVLTSDLDITNSQIEGSGSIESYPTVPTVLSANGGVINLNTIFPNTSALTLTNGTFVVTPGGSLSTQGNLTLTSATISGTSVNINAAGSLTLNSSTIPAGSITTGSDLSVTTSNVTASGAVSVGGVLTVTNSSNFTQAVGQTLSTTGNLNILSSSTLTSGMTNVGGNLTVDTASTLSSSNRVLTPFTTFNTVSNLNVTGNAVVSNGSTITTPSTTATEEYYLYLTAPNLTVDATSFIQVDGKGYRGKTNSYFHALGNADTSAYNGNTISTQFYAGGSYGGMGGTYQPTHYPNKPYGNPFSPIYLGSSGSCLDSPPCNDNGGGAIRLSISGTSTINGVLSSNGLAASDGGSGGSIYLQTGTLAGSGMMRANGAQNSNNPYYGSGSGGRVAVYYTTALNSWATASGKISGLQAFGGTSTNQSNGNTNRGGAGTILVKAASQTYGDLIINNNNATATDTTSTTPLNIPLSTASSVVTTSTLTAPIAFSTVYGNFANFFAGYFLNPNTAQNVTAKLSDDSMFLISSNDANTATISTNGMDSIAANGNTFSVVGIFDNLEVRGRAKLVATSIRVISGDLGSNDTATFVQDGGITAGVVDLGPAVTWSTTANASGTVTTQCSLNHSCP